MKLRFFKKGYEVHDVITTIIFLLLLLVVILFIIYQIKNKNISLVERIRELLFFR
ncbi:MAG: hypothetical protein ACP5OZ_03025 [Candidatus Woesearchaeota archaeon]